LRKEVWHFHGDHVPDDVQVDGEVGMALSCRQRTASHHATRRISNSILGLSGSFSPARVTRSTRTPRVSSSRNFKSMKRAKVAGPSNSTRRSRSLSSDASPRATDPNAYKVLTPSSSRSCRSRFPSARPRSSSVIMRCIGVDPMATILPCPRGSDPQDCLCRTPYRLAMRGRVAHDRERLTIISPNGYISRS
jgi:hypothetical protein